jgi:hypothetical protein
MANTFYILRTCQTAFNAVAPCYLPITESESSSTSIYIPANSCHMVILVGGEQYLTVALICISLLSIFSCAYFTSICLWWNVCPYSFPIFNWVDRLRRNTPDQTGYLVLLSDLVPVLARDSEHRRWPFQLRKSGQLSVSPELWDLSGFVVVVVNVLHVFSYSVACFS